ncbi:MAG: nucleotide exchange factor GrpE [Anaerolineaceae bacterium]|nr:nucleotide exchange factor GrpE [Anaerolineaceae bacterium]MBN2678376.1 nucleotide exchange factor GrpE [Anaerolineaceae bacterium]
MSEDKKKRPKIENERPIPEGEASKDENLPEGENQPQETMIALSMEEYDALQKQVEAGDNQAKEYLDSWQRERADFLNYKKRIEKEQEFFRSNVMADLVLKYLDIQDDLERALKSRPPELEGTSWVEGIDFIYHKLLALLEKEGVKQMIPTAEMFDPTLHEAVSQEENPDHPSGQIIEVISPGYQIGDRIIRPARVRVAR